MQTIIKNINDISGQYSTHEVFCDWVKTMAISISNAVPFRNHDVWQEREKAFDTIMDKYSDEDADKFAECVAHLEMELGKDPRDVLGEIYMQGGFGSSNTGQFFTPYNLSELSSKLGAKELHGNKRYRIAEPACGSGGMIIAAAMELKQNGVNYQRNLKVIAQDLDWNCVYMCYAQLSFLGIDAIVVQGDTLTNPYEVKNTEQRCVFRTPRNRGLIL